MGALLLLMLAGHSKLLLLHRSRKNVEGMVIVSSAANHPNWS